jgi:pimeloyl-ACP methyl ester carboxylesterase
MLVKTLTISVLCTLCLCLYSQERMVDINGQKFRIKEWGAGNTTVIFESGMSDSLETWGSIPDSVALFAHVLLYDRADIGKSGTSGNKRTIPNMVLELKSILNHEKIQPPYVLVGHSLGGYITRYFTSRFPEDIKGLLLLDPAPETYWGSMSEKQLQEYIRGGTEWYETRFQPRYRKEWYEFIPNMIYMKELNIPENLKVILVSASESGWYKYHREQLSGLKNAQLIRLKGVHHIYKSYPDSMVGYIKQLTLQQ